MAAPVNTFAAVMLAFPFYLAQQGRLSKYIELAKPSAKKDASTAQAPNKNAPPGNKGATPTNGIDLQQLSAGFSEASALFK